MQQLYGLFDERSGLCRWVQGWARDQPAFVKLMFLPAGSSEARRIAPGLLEAGAAEELVVVSDEGQVYRGDAAWIMCFYALEEFREWSFRLATPELRPMARKAFVMLSKNRVNVLDWLELTDREAVSVFARMESPAGQGAASSLQKIHQMIAGPEPRDGSNGP